MEEMVIRTLSCYRKESDSPSDEYPLTDIAVEKLRKLFDAGSDNPMFDVYPVGPEQVPFLQDALHRELDLEKYDYFVECHALPKTGGA